MLSIFARLLLAMMHGNGNPSSYLADVKLKATLLGRNTLWFGGARNNDEKRKKSLHFALSSSLPHQLDRYVTVQ